MSIKKFDLTIEYLVYYNIMAFLKHSKPFYMNTLQKETNVISTSNPPLVSL